jgi:hypothetical protein
VPVGCLAGLLLLLGFVALILMLVFGLMKSSDAYQQGLLKARSDPAVIQALGSPIQEGFFTTGHININGSSGHADLAIPVAGPKGGATLYVVADKSAGVWSFATLVVEVDGTHRRIDLLAGRTIP